MNEFTKEELKGLLNIILHSRDAFPFMHEDEDCTLLVSKLKSMIDNYQENSWNVKKIAKSHLNEATSLIGHAMCLLRMDEDE